MSFIVQSVDLTAQDMPVMIEYVTAPPYYTGVTYSWNITNYDSYVTYTVSTTNGSVSLAGVQIVYTPSTSGSGGFTVNGRNIPLTISSPYFIATLSSVTGDQARGVALDSSGNIYVVGFSGASNNIQLAKYNSTGTIQWQYELSGASIENGFSIAVDSSSNVYVVGTITVSGTSNMAVAKYNSAGTLQWQRQLGVPGSADSPGYAVAVDGSGNVYVGGSSDWDTGNANFVLAKYNSSGTLQWEVYFGGSSVDEIYALAVDSSSNVYATGISANELEIVKYDSSGTVLFQRRLYSAAVDRGYGVALDSSGNIYVVGSTAVSGTNDLLIAKYNNSGVIQWQQRLGDAGSDIGYGIAVDSSANVYVTGVANNDLQIAKYNTSGTIQWQRNISSAGNDTGYGIAATNAGGIVVVGTSTASGTNDILIAKLPDDGSKTGTYTVGGISLTYAVSTLTDTAAGLTDAATTRGTGASTVTDSAGTLTSAASSLTSATTAI